MPTEIERRFRVNESYKDTIFGMGYTAIKQGYIQADKERIVRVRINHTDDSIKAFLCVKVALSKMERKEFEYEIPVENANELMVYCKKAVVHKNRYEVFHKGNLWVIDEFLGENSPLVLAEIELESKEQVFEKPDWLGPEVTHKTQYTSGALSMYPYSYFSAAFI